MNLIQTLEAEEIARLNKTIPVFAPGDTVIVSVNVVEGTRKRVQAYEGVVIAKRNRGLNSGFTVRKISSGEGVERTFQTYSPLIAKIEVKRRGDVRRALGEQHRGLLAQHDRQQHRRAGGLAGHELLFQHHLGLPPRRVRKARTQGLRCLRRQRHGGQVRVHPHHRHPARVEIRHLAGQRRDDRRHSRGRWWFHGDEADDGRIKKQKAATGNAL